MLKYKSLCASKISKTINVGSLMFFFLKIANEFTKQISTLACTNTKFSEFRKVASLTGSEPGSLLTKKIQMGFQKWITFFVSSYCRQKFDIVQFYYGFHVMHCF